MNKPKKICLLGATFSTKNMGVSALTTGIIQSILHQFPEAEIFLLDYEKQKEKYQIFIQNRYISIKLINIRFSKNIFLRNHIVRLILSSIFLKILPFKKIIDKIITKNEHLKYINESDFVASIAGGDSFSDIYGFERFIYVSLPQILVLLMNKKLILLPQTLGPFKGRVVKWLASSILNRAYTVYSRDNDGLEEVKEILKEKYNSRKYKFCFDIGFIIDPIKPGNIDIFESIKKRDNNANLIGLNISGLLYRGGYDGKNMFGLKIDYKELIYDIIELLIIEKKIDVLLIPHTFGTIENSESDLLACREVYHNLKDKYQKKIFRVKNSYNQNEIKYIIGLCNFFIGSRMHACIAALSQNIPAISIAYSKKFKGVMQTIGIESLVADPREMTKEAILKLILKGIDNNELIKAHLEQITPRVKDTVQNIFKEINQIS